jgi:hypothetical protein
MLEARDSSWAAGEDILTKASSGNPARRSICYFDPDLRGVFAGAPIPFVDHPLIWYALMVSN